MALVPSTMLPLGTPAPDFALPDAVSGQTRRLADARGERGTLVMFICNHCPFVIHIQQALVGFARDYAGSELGIVAISANDPTHYPDDSPANMKRVAETAGYPFPYLFDDTQETARAYHAACTPDFFLFGADLQCVYRGRFDSSRPGSGNATGSDLRAAVDLLLAVKPIPADPQHPSMGCSIKWKPAPR